VIIVTAGKVRRGIVEIDVEGDLDTVTSGELRHVLNETRASKVELDLSRVAFLDCGGARTLLWADTHMRARGGTFTVVDPSAPVLRLLRLLGFDRYISIEGVVGAGRTGPGD
jgi:anti-anti-sigma factor